MLALCFSAVGTLGLSLEVAATAVMGHFGSDGLLGLHLHGQTHHVTCGFAAPRGVTSGWTEDRSGHRRQEWPGQASHRPNITSSAATVPSPPCGLKTRPSAQGQAGRALESTWGGRGHCQNPRNFAGLGKAGAGSKASCKGGDEIECGTQSEEPDCCTKPGL